MNLYNSANESWSRAEVELIVGDYISMFIMELRGERYNKAQHNRDLRRVLSGRSEKSIEWKHQNISAAFLDLDLPCIDGYKPAINYQSIVADVVAQQLAERLELVDLIASIVSCPSPEPSVDDILKSLIATPTPMERKTTQAVRERFAPSRRRRSYLLQDALNSALGAAGERFVINFERARLVAAGKPRLADRVEHISQTQGDGMGFDILSFETNTRERLIEVKTTKFGRYTPFFVTANELTRSKASADQYHIYRVFEFRVRPRMYVTAGAFDHSFALDPSQYVATLART